SASRAARTFATNPANSGSRSRAPCRSLVPMIVSVRAPALTAGAGRSVTGAGCEHATAHINVTTQAALIVAATLLWLGLAAIEGDLLLAVRFAPEPFERARPVHQPGVPVRRQCLGARSRATGIERELERGRAVGGDLHERRPAAGQAARDPVARRHDLERRSTRHVLGDAEPDERVLHVRDHRRAFDDDAVD